MKLVREHINESIKFVKSPLSEIPENKLLKYFKELYDPKNFDFDQDEISYYISSVRLEKVYEIKKVNENKYIMLLKFSYILKRTNEKDYQYVSCVYPYPPHHIIHINQTSRFAATYYSSYKEALSSFNERINIMT